MINKIAKLGLIICAVSLIMPAGIMAAQMKGKVRYLTNKFKTFLLVAEDGKTEIFKFGKKTPTLKPNDLVMVTYKSAGKEGKGIVKATSVKTLFDDGGISPERFKKLRKSGAYLLDVRNKKDTKKGIIPGATLIPLNKLESKLGGLPKDKKILVYCNSGPIAAIGYNILKNNGFNKVSYLAAKVKVRKGKLSIK